MTSAYQRFRNWVREGRCEPDWIRLPMLVMQAESGPAAEEDPGAVLEPCLDGENPPPTIYTIWPWCWTSVFGKHAGSPVWRRSGSS